MTQSRNVRTHDRCGQLTDSLPVTAYVGSLCPWAALPFPLTIPLHALTRTRARLQSGEDWTELKGLPTIASPVASEPASCSYFEALLRACRLGLLLLLLEDEDLDLVTSRPKKKAIAKATAVELSDGTAPAGLMCSVRASFPNMA